ncbi:MAG: ATP-binding protein [Acidobacteriota bacterium]|nr:ATP-binding protein [Acidobacteriota bacterium]
MAKSKPHLVLENVGPIRRADVCFSDLTVLVGPQATGKSLFLQFLKLVLDHGPITAGLRNYGLDWNTDTSNFLEVYLGRGMSSVWRSRGKAKSWLRWREELVHLDAIVAEKQPGTNYEQCFVIPAQRVLAFSSQSWLRPFSDFRAGDPFVIRAFSEHLRLHAEPIFETGKDIWRLDDEAYSLLQNSIFGKFDLTVQTTGVQKELVLSSGRSGKPLPFMVWSAGQREFVPLLLALIWLLPARSSLRKQRCNWVLIEEPEMGLHPKAIAAVLFVILELLGRGYRVCLSTHSTHVLDLVWALQVFRKTKARPEALLSIFGVPPRKHSLQLARTVLEKEAAVFYFDDESRETQNISSLSPDDDDPTVYNWGKLTEFTTQVGDIIAQQVAQELGD